MSHQTYADKLRAQIPRWRDRINELETRAGRAGATTCRDDQERLRDLRAKQQAAERKLKKLDRTGRPSAGAGRDRPDRVLNSRPSGLRGRRDRNRP